MLSWPEKVVLFQGVYSLVLCVDFNLDRVYQRCTLELLDLVSHSGREEEGVPLLGDLCEDKVDLLLKIHGQKPVSLVKDKELKFLQVEALSVGKVVSHTSWCTYNDVWLL